MSSLNAECELKASQGSHGIVKYENETLGSVNAHGRVSIVTTTVTGPVQVKGILTAENSSLGSLQVHGKARIKDCTINGPTTIYGYLDGEKTKFQNTIEAYSRKMRLRACSVDSIRIPQTNGSNKPPVIALLSGTTVAGSIIVESGNGEIWLSSDSEILGEVQGATVKKK